MPGGATPRWSAWSGDHATYHKRYDAPLESDIEALAGTVSGWVRRAAARRGRWPATRPRRSPRRCPARTRWPPLILPADVSWADGAEPAAPLPVPAAMRPWPAPVIDAAATVLRGGEPSVILLGGAGLHRPGLAAASRIAGHRGPAARRDVPGPASSAARASRRSSGSPTWPRWPPPSSAGARHLILAGARAPVSFFAYPGKVSSLVPDGCQVHTLAGPGDDVPGALAALAELRRRRAPATHSSRRGPACPDGDLTGHSAAA